MNIYIGEPVEYSDMQGPAPDGFHVPLSTEWQAIVDAYTGLGLSGGTNFSVYLKIPFTGYRSYNNLSVHDRGSWGSYWSSTNLGSNRAYVLLLGNSDIYTQEYQYRSTACSIRLIKDTPVTPTSSWNKLYGTSIESGGIFHNVTDGLISISSDGSTWYTLMDKNLGATTVYNYGDTLSYTNCGNYYQRGNNYGFGWEDASQITQSSTQVNVTGYGPGNYYESSTWITTSTRQNSANDGNNLRGGVSQGSGTKSVEVQNIYIGEKPSLPYLCFTANTAGSTLTLNKNGNPNPVTLETSMDGETWNTYTTGSTITLSNIGDKVYWRNTSEVDTGFSFYSNYYEFAMTGSIAASGDVNYLLNKNSTDTLSTSYCFADLFLNCSSLTSAPELPATTLTDACYMNMFRGTNIVNAPSLSATTLKNDCYSGMFYGCSSLEGIPALSATVLPERCYWYMFGECPKVKISSSQTGAYQTAYRIPTTGSAAPYSGAITGVFYQTGGTFTGTPSVNTTYYTSNTIV